MKKSLTRRERLSGKREIEALFRTEMKFESRGLRLLVRSNNLPANRVLFTTRRGIVNAVARNRQKRILREIYRNIKSVLIQGFDLAIILKKDGSPFDELRTCLIGLFKQADLFIR